MGLIICPDCGKNFSEHAKACPECGCPMSYIKKIKSTAGKKPISKLDKIKEQKPISFYSSLPIEIKDLFGVISKKLKSNNISYIFENNDKLCGYRKESEGKLFCYVSLNKNKEYFISIKNIKTDINTIELYDSKFNDSYVVQVINAFNTANKIKPQKNIEKKFEVKKENYFTDLAFYNDLFDFEIKMIKNFLNWMSKKNYKIEFDEKTITFNNCETFGSDKNYWFKLAKLKLFGDKDVDSVDLCISYNIEINGRETKFNHNVVGNWDNTFNYLCDIVDRVDNHRAVLPNLPSYSIYANLIKWSCKYAASFPDNFKEMLDYAIPTTDKLKSYRCAVDCYKEWKFKILHAFFDNKLQYKNRLDYIIDLRLFNESLENEIKAKRYSLGMLSGVTSKFSNLLDNEYDEIISYFERWDLEAISDKLLEL